MKTIVPVFVLATIIGFVGAVSAGPVEESRAVLNRGGERQVEQLVNIAAKSPQAAAKVIETVARTRPKLLLEVMQGISLVLSGEEFALAVDLAVAALADLPPRQALVAKIGADIEASATASGGDAGVEAEGEGSIRIGEEPSDGDDQDPPPSPS